MSPSHVHYAVTDHIATITLARPPLNAFSIAFLDEIIAALRRASTDPDIRVVVLSSGIEKMFCAGLDLDIILGSGDDLVEEGDGEGVQWRTCEGDGGDVIGDGVVDMRGRHWRLSGRDRARESPVATDT